MEKRLVSLEIFEILFGNLRGSIERIIECSLMSKKDILQVYNELDHFESIVYENYEGGEKVCVDCGATYHISGKEVEWYKKKNLDIPLRCKSCRDSRRKESKKYILNSIYGTLALKNEIERGNLNEN